jgi:hypothetical protein
MRATVNGYGEAMEAIERKMMAEMDANLEKMKACIRATETCLGKTKASRKAGQKQKRAEMKTSLEETKATESEANQEKIKAVAEHYKGTPRVRATHLLTALHCRASGVARGAPKGLAFEKRRWTRPECSNGIRDRGIKRKLRLRSAETVNGTLKQILEL